MKTISRKLTFVSNPHGKKSSEASAARKKGQHMAHVKAVKAAANGGKKKRTNPFKKKYEELKKRKSNRSRNPGAGEVFGRPTDLVVTGLAALGSAVATKQLPQMVLAENNTGAQGYFANGVVTAIVTWGAAAFIGKAAAQGALAGGLVIILDRVLTDKFSQLGPYLQLSGVGDATSYGKLGTIRDGYYLHPDLRDANGRLITPAPVLQDAVAAVVSAYPQIAAPVMAAVQSGGHLAGTPADPRAHAGSTMMLSSRFRNRFGR